MRQLKQDGKPEIDVKRAVNELKARKKLLEDKELELAPAVSVFDENSATLRTLLIPFSGCHIRSVPYGSSSEASLFLRSKFCDLRWHCRPVRLRTDGLCSQVEHVECVASILRAGGANVGS